MPSALPIRADLSPVALRRLARRERDGRVSARLLALAHALEGMRQREEAARLAGMTGQTLGDWVHRYNAGGPGGLADRSRSGRPCALNEGQQATLKALVLRGPKPERDGCVAWRVRDLRALAERRFSAWFTARPACCGSCTASISPGRRRARFILRPISRRKRASKKPACGDARSGDAAPRG